MAVQDELYCTMCDKLRPISKFWTSDSIVNPNGHLHICGDHINSLFDSLYKKERGFGDEFIVDSDSIIYDEVTEQIIKETCRYIDLLYSKDTYSVLQTHTNGFKDKGKKVSKIFGVYKSKLSTTVKKNGGIASGYQFSDATSPIDKKLGLGISEENLIHLQDKYGYGYKDYEYMAFERKYKKLIKGYSEKTALHTERLNTYIIHKVKGELAAAEGDVANAEKWEKLSQSDATAAKLNISQLSKSDITGGIDLIPQLVEAIEEKASLIGIMPKLKAQPYDDADIILWGTINKLRRLEEKSPISYKEIWDFYDEMLRETFKQRQYTEDEIQHQIDLRIKPFKDLGEVYKEPLYSTSEADLEEGDEDGISE